MGRAASYMRHVRYRDFDGIDRGTLRTAKEFLDGRADTAANNGIGDTAAQVTFTAANATNELTATAHGYSDGDGPFILATAGTLPAGLDNTTRYWVRVVDANTLTLSLSRADATVVTFSDDGTGAHTMELATTVPDLEEFLRQGVSAPEMKQLTDIDDATNHF